MREIDQKVPQVMNEKHFKRQEYLNKDREQLPAFSSGDLVWYLRPADSGDKLATRWIGPAMVVAREAENSYVIEVKPGYETKAHRGLL